MDDALKIEKEGGQMNMCKALEELEEKGEIKSKISLIQKKSQRHTIYSANIRNNQTKSNNNNRRNLSDH